MNINNLWNSKEESDWINALNAYWTLIKPANLELEKKLDVLDCGLVENMELDEFYDFLISDYLKWKYTDCRWIENIIKNFSKYVSEEKLDELLEIKNDLFSFDLNDVELGLRTAHKIRGLGIAGASGLLSILFPNYFGTVDQFVVKALIEIDSLPEKSLVIEMNPMNLKYTDGTILINIMKNKAKELNKIFNTKRWNPRAIDKVLWAVRNGMIKSTTYKYISKESTTKSVYTNSNKYAHESTTKINIEKFIVNNSIISKDKKILKALFIEYLMEYHPELNSVDTYFTDAIFILNNKNSIKLNFLETISGDRDFIIYRERLVKHFINKGWTVEKSKTQSQYYIRAISLFRDFITTS